MSQYTFKFKADAKGNFYSNKDSFELDDFDMIVPHPNSKLVLLTLHSPKDAYIKALNFSLNKKYKLVEVSTGKPVKFGPFPLVVGKNPVSFEGTSDTPGVVHEIEVVPQFLS